MIKYDVLDLLLSIIERDKKMELQDILDLHVEMNSSDRYTYNGKNVPRVTEVLSKMIS